MSVASKRNGAPFLARSVEPVFPIRMLALDIDGTLVDDDLALGERTRLAIARAIGKGVRVSLVTGRMTGSAVRFAGLLGLRDPIVGYQGALVRAMPRLAGRAGELLYHRPIPPETAREAVAWTKAHGLEPHINHLESLVIPADDPLVDDYSAFLGVRAIRVDDLESWIHHPVTKVVAVGEPPGPTSLLPRARAEFAGRAEATVAHPRFLEFIAQGISKGAAVRWLARRQGIPMGAVLAAGDQLNDLEMLSAVGHGAAMPHAPGEVRAVARYLAPPVAFEGVAELVESLVLAPPARARATAARLAAETRERAAGPPVVADDTPGLAAAAGTLQAGGIVALPTDTVYGIAVAADTQDGIARLFAAKRRRPERAVPLLLADAAQAAQLGEMGPAATALAEAFWPGGLTLVLPLHPDASLPAGVVGTDADGRATVGVRVPDHPVPRALAAAVGPLPATSANLSGQPEATDAHEIAEHLGAGLALIVDGGPARGGPASSVVAAQGSATRVLRAGAIPVARLAEVLAAAGLPAPEG